MVNKIRKAPNNLLVTGGCGFIGSNFIKYFLSNNKDSNVFNLDKMTYCASEKNLSSLSGDIRLNTIIGDICDKDLVSVILEKNEIDCIVNFAAESHVDNSIKDSSSFIKTNILGTYNLLECSRDLKDKTGKDLIFLHVSTDEVFGSLDIDDDPFTEENQYDPNSPYSASKASSDHLVNAWHETYGIPTLISNCSNNYGPNQFKEKLIPVIILNAIAGNQIPIYGDGKNIRDWLYVEDHCIALDLIIKKGEIGETYNIGGGNELSNISLVEKICLVLDHRFPVTKNKKLAEKEIFSYKDLITFVPDRPGHDFRYAIDSSKLRNLGWVQTYDTENGLRSTIDWYLKENKEI